MGSNVYHLRAARTQSAKPYHSLKLLCVLISIVQIAIQVMERLPELLKTLIDFERFFSTVNMRHAIACFEHAQPGGLLLNPALTKGCLKRHSG